MKGREGNGASMEDIQRALGPRIALMRHRAALTLEELAAKTGFTKGYLSRIENSRVIPPIGTLVRLANVLGYGVSDLVAPSGPAASDHRVSFVKRADRQPVVQGGNSFGYDYFALASPGRGRRMMPFIMIFADSAYKDVRFDHEGEEFLFVIQGRIAFEIVVDGRPQLFRLEPGDSLYFDSTLPHRGRSVRGKSKALIVVTEKGRMNRLRGSARGAPRSKTPSDR